MSIRFLANERSELINISLCFKLNYRILQALNRVTEALVIGPENKLQKVQRNFAISLQVVEPQTFTGLAFSWIANKPQDSELKTNSISIEFSDVIPPTSSASIAMPPTIFNDSAITNSSGQNITIFAFYKETKFFATSLESSTKTQSRLNTFVIAGSIKGLPIKKLVRPVQIALRSITRADTNTTLCSHWDFGLDNWSQEGCVYAGVLGDGLVLCNCSHLTNFAMLMVRISFNSVEVGYDLQCFQTCIGTVTKVMFLKTGLKVISGWKKTIIFLFALVNFSSHPMVYFFTIHFSIDIILLKKKPILCC